MRATIGLFCERHRRGSGSVRNGNGVLYVKRKGPWLATGAPSVLGAGFPILVKLDHMMFGAGWITGRTAIGIEFFYLLIWLVCCLSAILLTVRFVRAGEAISVPGVILGLVIGVALVYVGINNGAAVLYAT